MAYNKRNLLKKILAIQEIVAHEYAKGIPYTVTYRNRIADQYHISYSTFNNYLSCNAKLEIEKLERKEAKSKKQMTFNFE